MEDFFHFEPPRTLLKQLTEIKIIFLILLSAFIFLPTMSASSISEHFHILTWIPKYIVYILYIYILKRFSTKCVLFLKKYIYQLFCWIFQVVYLYKWSNKSPLRVLTRHIEYTQSSVRPCILDMYFFRQSPTFIKVHVAFVFGLQTL